DPPAEANLKREICGRAPRYQFDAVIVGAYFFEKQSSHSLSNICVGDEIVPLYEVGRCTHASFAADAVTIYSADNKLFSGGKEQGLEAGRGRITCMNVQIGTIKMNSTNDCGVDGKRRP